MALKITVERVADGTTSSNHSVLVTSKIGNGDAPFSVVVREHDDEGMQLVTLKFLLNLAVSGKINTACSSLLVSATPVSVAQAAVIGHIEHIG